MSSLVQLYGGFDELLFRIEEQGGELTPELEKELEVFSEAIAQKVDNVGLALAAKEKDIEGLKQFKKSIDGGIKSAENTVKNFKAFLAKVCQKHGETTKEGKKFLKGKVVRFGDITRKVRSVEYLEKVPDEYLEQEIELTLADYFQYKEKLLDAIAPDLGSQFRVKLKMPFTTYKECCEKYMGFSLIDRFGVTPDMEKIGAAETLPDGCKEETIYNIRVDKKRGVEVTPSYEAINE
jgi:hypothetical protein